MDFGRFTPSAVLFCSGTILGSYLLYGFSPESFIEFFYIVFTKSFILKSPLPVRGRGGIKKKEGRGKIKGN